MAQAQLLHGAGVGSEGARARVRARVRACAPKDSGLSVINVIASA